MKNIISNFLKGVGVITITAGIIYAADLTLTSGQPITEQKWSDLVAEINALKAENIAQETKINDIVASGGSVVVKKDEVSLHSTTFRDWEISGLIPGKPVIINLMANHIGNSDNGVYIRIIDGVESGKWSGNGNQKYLLYSYTGTWGTSNSMVIVPNAASIKLSIAGAFAGGSSTLYAYH